MHPAWPSSDARHAFVFIPVIGSVIYLEETGNVSCRRESMPLYMCHETSAHAWSRNHKQMRVLTHYSALILCPKPLGALRAPPFDCVFDPSTVDCEQYSGTKQAAGGLQLPFI
jgi:hypothetical protein